MQLKMNSLIKDYQTFNFHFTPLAHELWLLQRILYKHQHSLKRCKEFQKLQGIKSYLKRILHFHQSYVTRLGSISTTTPKKKNTTSVGKEEYSNPTTMDDKKIAMNTSQDFLLHLQSIKKLLLHFVKPLCTTATHLRHQLSQTYFMSFSFLGLACIARLLLIVQWNQKSIQQFIVQYHQLLAIEKRKIKKVLNNNSKKNNDDCMSSSSEVNLFSGNITHVKKKEVQR
ncbi:hypothetical protein HMI56_006921 [Coelomomyces lativittatus]|nr:hypothetical protein HMI56_006921 [Coelomomyces lativittatus]